MSGIARIRCMHCKQRRDYQASGVRLTLHPNGTIIMRFFCTVCYEFNSQRTNEDFAEALTDMGVPTVVIGTPLELEENHDLRSGTKLTELDVGAFEDMSIHVFNRRLEFEMTRGGLCEQ